ncbi:hypothetical protein K1719_034097 [Acacia pycnantha]|nr:hypothetical protein K1719_034097 [Acacia pycnantha]
MDETIFHIAARYGHHEIVRKIIDHAKALPRDIDGVGAKKRLTRALTDKKDTALHEIAGYLKEKVSHLLTRNLSTAKAANENGWVPLHLEALFCNPDVVEELVRKDRSTTYCSELVDEKGHNALHCIAMDKGICLRAINFTEEKEILENAPLMRNLCNEKDNVGNTPLHYIAQLAPKWETHYDHFLLEPQFLGQVDMMVCNKYGQNPLDVAAADMTRVSAIEVTCNRDVKGVF